MASLRRRSLSHHRSPLLFCLATCLVGTGCNPPPRPQFDLPKSEQLSSESARYEATVQQQNDAGDVVPLSKLPLPWETWHAYFIQGKKVGFIHVGNRMDDESLDKQVLTTIDESLLLRRGDTQFVQVLRQKGWERRDGSLIAFSAETKIGPSISRYRGDVRGDLLAITSSRIDGKRTLPWKSYYRGLTAVQQSLLAKPLQLKQSRRFRELMPVYYQVALVELDCKHRVSITTLDDKVHDALEIDLSMSVEGQTILSSTIWTDEQGNLLKCYTPAVDLTAIACSKLQAEEPFHAEVDALSVLAIPVTGRLLDSTAAQATEFILRPKKAVFTQQSDPLITPQSGQWVCALANGEVRVVVSRNEGYVPASDFKAFESKAQAADLQHNSLMNGKDAVVSRLARLSQSDKSRQIALDLTKTVHQLIKPGNYSRGFASATETALDGIGDCSERAILLAAMLRAREIPSRVVAGLVYVPSAESPKLAYHMWTIAYVDDHWLSLDATLGDAAPADRIAIASSSLADGNVSQLLDPLLRFAGQYSVEIRTSEQTVEANASKPSDDEAANADRSAGNQDPAAT